jgi:fructose-bisphosphate aldolase, class I
VVVDSVCPAENEGAKAVADAQSLLGGEAEDLLAHTCHTIAKEDLVLPGVDFVDRVVAAGDRSPRVLRNLQAVFDHGRLAGTGYLSILPVDQSVEHSAAWPAPP